MVTWWKQQTTAALSSIDLQPTVDDVRTFVGIAESEGLLFFSQTWVYIVRTWNDLHVELTHSPGS
jgi:hypothetical protein